MGLMGQISMAQFVFFVSLTAVWPLFMVLKHGRIS
jgi:hypothetical protein